MDLFAPFEPSPTDPWDQGKASHLARRAGFGATASEVAALVEAGPEAAVARFVDFPDVDERLEAEIAALGGPLVDFEAVRGAGPIDPLRRYWLYRMVHGSHPLQEKLTLLWHDHFACQESKVIRLPMLRDQNRRFRTLGAGPFRWLLGAIARDPAMLHALDNRVSTKLAPNENWARELLELYTLGVDRYEQRDVVELARVFTGWTTPNLNENTFAFDPDMHDEGDKIVFGERLAGRAGAAGLEEGEEALDRIVTRPDCARFIAEKLLGWFAVHAPTDEEVEALGAVLESCRLDIRTALRTLFGSAWFYAAPRRRAMVRNPVEFVVAAARAIGVQNADRAGLEHATHRMGMTLLEPPSVAGWEHGAAWTGPGTAAARVAVGLALSELPHAARRIVGRATIDLDALVAPAATEDGFEPDALIEALLARLAPDLTRRGDAPLDARRRDVLVAFAGEALAEAPEGLSAAKRRRRAARAVLHIVLVLPDLAVA